MGDEMGLGKTVQMIGLLAGLRRSTHLVDRAVTSRYVTSGYVASGYVASRHVISRYLTSRYVASGYVTSRYVTSRYVPMPSHPGMSSRFTISRCAIPGHHIQVHHCCRVLSLQVRGPRALSHRLSSDRHASVGLCFVSPGTRASGLVSSSVQRPSCTSGCVSSTSGSRCCESQSFTRPARPPSRR